MGVTCRLLTHGHPWQRKGHEPSEEAAACPAAWEPRRQSPTACLEAWGRPQLARPQQTLSEFSANSSFSCFRGPSLSFPLCPQNRSQDEWGRGTPPALTPPPPPSPLSHLQGFPLSKLSAHKKGTPFTTDPEVQGRLCWGQDGSNHSQSQERDGVGGVPSVAPRRQSNLPGRCEPAQHMLCAQPKEAPGESLSFPPTASCRAPHGSPPDFNLHEETTPRAWHQAHPKYLLDAYCVPGPMPGNKQTQLLLSGCSEPSDLHI